MSKIRFLLQNYFKIINEETSAKYLNCKNTHVIFDKKDKLEKLWNIHDEALNKKNIVKDNSGKSLLDLKLEISKRIFRNCHFCERRCSIDRNKRSGSCRVEKTKIASEFLHIGEERVLIPSHTIFFSGCTFHCVFCQNWDISQENCGLHIRPDHLCEIIQKGKEIYISKNA